MYILGCHESVVATEKSKIFRVDLNLETVGKHQTAASICGPKIDPTRLLPADQTNN